MIVVDLWLGFAVAGPSFGYFCGSARHDAWPNVASRAHIGAMGRWWLFNGAPHS
ncbi:hypothetical protein shim_29080 [Shimia sp. SK013]|nr:hypothetical protein shim_29080 [Shimia sp. SK013]